MVTKATTKKTEPSKAPAAAVKAKPAASGKPAATAKPAPAAKPVPKAKPAVISHDFSLTAPEAKDVFLVGEFNNWDATALRMKKSKNGVFTKAMKLAPGRYEYLFNVDGQWITDPACGERVTNPFGSENSVVTLG